MMASDQFNIVSILIDSPQKQLTVLESYISFRVTSQVVENESAEEPESYIVRRRYSDFVWLRSSLIERFPTLIVPALPGKHSVLGHLDRFSRPFIMTRMALLNSYLQRLASHPVFSSSPLFKLFLTAKHAEFTHCSKGSDGIFDKISGSFHHIAGYLPKYAQLNHEFVATRSYVDSLCDKFSQIQSISSRMFRERTELQNELLESQTALKVWCDQEPTLNNPLNIILESINTLRDNHKLSILDSYTKCIQQPIDEYILYLDAVKEALNRRDAIQLSFETTVEEGNRKKEEREQLRALQAEANGFGFRLWKLSAKEKVKRLQLEIPDLEKLTEEHHDRMEIANEAIRADLERWNGEKKSEIKNILSGLAEGHISYYQQSVEAWEQALSAIQGLQKNLDGK